MSLASAPDRLPHLDETEDATARYLQALTGLTEDHLHAPSLLPGWTRAHVVTHVARNADGLRNLLVWARTGVETPQYPSWEQRNADIDSGAGRTRSALLEDSRAAAAAFADEVSRLTATDWDAPVRGMKRTTPFPARDVLRSRRVEVEVHHADLGIGYTPADWPADFTAALVEYALADRDRGHPMVLQATDTDDRWQLGDGGGPQIRGSAADLAWWLVGRGDAARLTSSAEIPDLGRWR